MKAFWVLDITRHQINPAKGSFYFERMSGNNTSSFRFNVYKIFYIRKRLFTHFSLIRWNYGIEDYTLHSRRTKCPSEELNTDYIARGKLNIF